MKNSLEEFIKKNRDEFDSKVPNEKVWDKIQANLPGMKQVTLWNSVTLWRVAALLFMGLSVYLVATNKQVRIKDKEQVSEIQGEFFDVETYYSKEIAKKVALIDHLDQTFENDQFTQDFQKLDAMYQVLRDEMKNRPTEKVKDALILNLLVRIDLLNQQLKRLEDLKKDKTKTDPSSV